LLRTVFGEHLLIHLFVKGLSSFPGGHNLRVFGEDGKIILGLNAFLALNTFLALNDFCVIDEFFGDFAFTHLPLLLRTVFGGHLLIHRFVKGFNSFSGGHLLTTEGIAEGSA
jgi:hypothetical protein